MEQTDLQTIQTESQTFIEMANAQTVLNQEEADTANTTLQTITQGLKQIEAKRKTFTAPLNQSLKEINKTFKDLFTPINEAKQGLTSRLMAWRLQEQERIDAEREKVRKEEERRRKIQEAHAAKGHNVKEDITPVAKPIPFSVKDTTKTRLTWTYEIEDEAKVPREYLEVNRPSITAAVRGGVRQIDGVRIYQKETAVFG